MFIITKEFRAQVHKNAEIIALLTAFPTAPKSFSSGYYLLFASMAMLGGIAAYRYMPQGRITFLASTATVMAKQISSDPVTQAVNSIAPSATAPAIAPSNMTRLFKAITYPAAKAVEAIHGQLPEEIRNNPALNAPIISTFLQSTISLLSVPITYLTTYRQHSRLQNNASIDSNLTMCFQQAEQYKKEFRYYDAYQKFKEIRIDHVQKNKSSFLPRDYQRFMKIAYQGEIIALFQVGTWCYDIDALKTILNLIQEALLLSPDELYLVNIRGLIALFLKQETAASQNFEYSLRSNPLAPDIKIFKAAADKTYTRQIYRSEANNIIYTFSHAVQLTCLAFYYNAYNLFHTEKPCDTPHDKELACLAYQECVEFATLALAALKEAGPYTIKQSQPYLELLLESYDKQFILVQSGTASLEPKQQRLQKITEAMIMLFNEHALGEEEAFNDWKSKLQERGNYSSVLLEAHMQITALC